MKLIAIIFLVAFSKFGFTAEYKKLLNLTKEIITERFNKNININSDFGVMGNVFPKPKYQNFTGNFFCIDRNRFEIKLGKKNNILISAANRCRNKIFYIDTDEYSCPFDYVFELYVSMLNMNEDINIDIDQGYTLQIQNGLSILSANTIWGALYGLQSFSQSVFFDKKELKYFVKETYIADSPEYKFRGSLIDTSRHYISTDLIKKHLDAMESVKLNVLHWHIVDDESFPYVSKSFPELHTNGAFDSRNNVYTVTDVKEIVQYAKYRGINIMPEFDTPGHAESWRGKTDVYVSCKKFSTGGLIDPSVDATYEFIKKLTQEVKLLFKTSLFHIGGDEVDSVCWFDYERISSYAKSIGAHNSSELQAHYTKRLLQNINNTFDSLVAWEEVYSDLKFIDKNLIIQIWKLSSKGEVLIKAINDGLRVILSDKYYFPRMGEDYLWENLYATNPREGIPIEKQNLVLGGEFCQWGEKVSQSNFLQDTWERGAIIAERLWSPMPSTIDYSDVLKRLNEHHCRLMRMNIPSHPVRTSMSCL